MMLLNECERLGAHLPFFKRYGYYVFPHDIQATAYEGVLGVKTVEGTGFGDITFIGLNRKVIVLV